MKIPKENKIKYGTVSLPLPLIEKVKEKIKGTGMNSVSSYVSFILREILSMDNNFNLESDKKDKEELKKKLENLGY